MRQVRAEASVSDRAGNRVAVYASRGFEDAPASGYIRVEHCRLLLGVDPRGKPLRTVNVNPQQHLGVLRAAILRALAKKDAGLVRIDPHVIHAIGNQVGLARQLRNPETVVRVGGKQRQKSGCRVRGIAYRNVQLIGSDDALLWITKLPPELVSDGDDLDRILRLRSILNRVDHSCGCQKQDDDDQNRNHGPRQFNLRASVNLGRLPTVIPWALAVFHDRIGQQSKDNRKNQTRDRKDEA